MADGIAPSRTIPEMLLTAASRDPDGVWVRADEGSLTFSAAAARVAAAAQALRDAGVRHGDLVMVTARTTPPYLICWLVIPSQEYMAAPNGSAHTARIFGFCCLRNMDAPARVPPDRTRSVAL